MILPFCLACAIASSTPDVSSLTESIRGRIEGAAGAALRVFAVPLRVRADGRPEPAQKRAVFAAACGDRIARAAEDGAFELVVEPGSYAVFAFADLDGNGRWDPGGAEPFGWYATEPCGRWAPVAAGARDVRIVLRAPRHFPRGTQHSAGGTLCRAGGYPLLQLRGSARERGHAHGYLIAPQIVDFFRFYVLEDKLGSAREYIDGFAEFLATHFALPEEYVAECDAVIQGMRDSGADLFLPELGREFSRTDLFAINAYIETRAMRSSCTQFAAWGERTAGTDVDGGMITGRNMDGECDIRKVTVSHFLLFAVEPTDGKRYVSMMWPGFVGTISGINEDGFYTMENAGGTGPGPVVDRLVPISWTMREALARLGADATADSVRALLDEFDNAAGGSCGPGCIMLFAVPYRGQATAPAWVCEGDRFGEAMRLPGAVRPELPDAILCSNHHLVYGADPDRPGTYFGRDYGFSSEWRYEAGMHRLEGWDRTGRKIGTAEMRDLLQTVAHGTTEYAIITRPNAGDFDVAVASLDAELWDAPYRAWTTFGFEDVFAVPPASLRWDEQPGESLALLDGDQVLWRFHYGKDAPKPFFHPLAPRGGPVLTRDRPSDHVWHHGLWFSWKYVDGVNFWEHDRETGLPAGRTICTRSRVVPRKDHSARIELELEYRPSAEETVLVEKRRIDVSRPDRRGAFEIDWTSRFEAVADEVVLDRTPLPGEPGGKAYGGYAGLSLRMADLEDRAALTPDGEIEFNEQDRYRGRHPALEYHGTIDGSAAGIAICTHPDNLNAPSPWYAIRSSKMTFFTPAVICYGPHSMQRGERFGLRYLVNVHNGGWSAAELGEAARAFAGAAGRRKEK